MLQNSLLYGKFKYKFNISEYPKNLKENQKLIGSDKFVVISLKTKVLLMTAHA